MSRPLRRAERRSAPFAGAPPAHAEDFPDPYVLRVDEVYYAYGTQAGGLNLPVLRSRDLATWEVVGDALPALHRWSAPGRTWSPAVHPFAGGYVMYHAVRERVTDRQAI